MGTYGRFGQAMLKMVKDGIAGSTTNNLGSAISVIPKVEKASIWIPLFRSKQ